MSRFDIEPTEIAGVFGVERRPIGDARGSLTRLFCAEELAQVGWPKPIAQINQTRTATKGTVRGMHFQYPPSQEAKLVMCLHGRVFDVAVDLRKGSPSFLTHTSAILSEDNLQALVIPEGCAHGFQTLTDDVELLYLHSAPYDGAREDGVSPFDPRLAIEWPLPVALISDRDRNHRPIADDFAGIAL